MDYLVDALVADLKARVPELAGIPVYGGTTKDEYYDLESRGELKFPAVYVRSLDFAPLKQRVYGSNKQGTPVTRRFSADALPFESGPIIYVSASSQQQAESLAKDVCGAYAGGVMLGFPNSACPGETCPLFLRTDVMKETSDIRFEESYGPVFSYVIGFTPHTTPKPMFVNDEAFRRAESLRSAQLDLMHAAKCCSQIAENGKALTGVIEEQVGYIISPKPGKMSSMLNGIGDNRKMHKAFVSGFVVDRGMFEGKFPEAVADFPDLYDRVFTRREPLNSIVAQMQAYYEGYGAQAELICDKLGVPRPGGWEVSDSPRDETALKHYVDVMERNPQMGVSDAVESYRELCEEVRREREAEKTAAKAAFTAAVVGGVAKGLSGEHHKSSWNYELPDLWGTAACMMGQLEPGREPGSVGSIIRTCMQCPKSAIACKGRH